MARYRRRGRGRRFLDIVGTFLLFTGVAFVTALLDQLNSERLGGRFEVVDGDSLRQGNRDFRLVGIDAPEYSQTCRRNGANWACGRAAREHLQELMAGGGVQCEGHELDIYDRLLVRCYRGDDLINRQMVTDGYAVSFGDHSDAELVARADNRGIWASEFMRPSEWRHSQHGGVLDGEHGFGLRDYIRAGVRWVRSLASQGEGA